MKRLCIFSFYNPKGEVKPYVEYLLNELKTCSEHIIFAVNGILTRESKEIVIKYTKDIYIRPNKGYDAGAYKDVICKYLDNGLINYDEVIFCNNSFWGPFIPMNEIFQKIEIYGESDFWGFCYTENNFANHIPAMFMVFKKKIISSGLLQKYLMYFIDETTESKNFVIASYEIGLFDFLVRKHDMKFQFLSPLKGLNIYLDAEICIRKHNLPILKRQIGEAKFFDKDKTINTLNTISRKFKYDINIILKDLWEDYGIKIDGFELLKHNKIYDNIPVGVLVSSHGYEEIKKFTEKGPFYIMGAGFYGTIVWWLYAKENKYFLGFLISDNQLLPKEGFLKKRIYYLSKVKLNNINILVAMNKEKTLEVATLFSDAASIMYLSM